GEAPKNGTVTVDEKTGEYTYKPNPDYHGDDKFTVVVSDGNGGEVTVTVPVTVTPVNDVPETTKSEQPIETQEDHPKKGQITDVTDKDGDELTYKVGEEPKSGQVVIDEKTGEYTYTPNPDYHGDDKFTVVVSDGNGGEVTVTVPVTVTPENDAPKLDDAEVTVKQGVKDPIVHNVNDASTGKDEDVDGDKLTYAITKGNEDGLFVIDPNTGVITLAHGKMLDHGKAPLHKLEVTATDSSSDKLSSTATITINVSNDSKITTEITSKGTITGTTDNVEKGPVKLTITGTDKNGNPVTIERDVELDRPDGSSKGQYTYQLTPEDGIVDGSKVTVEAKTVDRQGDTIHADTELPGHSGEETPGLDLVVPTIEITQVATDEKVTWGKKGKEGFEVKGTTTGVEAGQIVTVTFDKTVDGQPVTVEATVGKDGSWTAQITPEQAAKLLEGSVSATVKDIAGNEKSAEAVEYTIDAPTAVITGYGDNIENVLNTVVAEGKVSETVTISSEIDPNLANDTTKTMVGETITGAHGTFTLDASGEWTYTLNPGEATSKALIDSKGPLTEIFTVKDSEGKSYEVKVSINDGVANDGENVVVSATTSSLQDPSNVNSDLGAYTIYTNDSLGEITGTTSQGVEKVRVYVNKQSAGTDAEMDSLGYPQYFEVAVKDGKWSLSEQDLTDGLQKTWWADQLRNDDIYLQVRAVDPTTGKVGEVSEKYTFVVDTVAPEATYVNYADGQVTALVSGDPADAHRAATGNDVIVKYTDTDGNVQVVTGKVGDKAMADKPYLSISVAVKDPSKVDSATDFKVYVKDSAGNIGVNNDSKENPLKIELPTPQVDQYHDNVNNVSGKEIIGNTGYSDDPSGLISGTIVLTEADLKVVDSVRVYLYDNRQNWIEIDKNDLVKESDNTYRWTTKPGDLSKVTTTGKLAEGEVKFYAATYDKESGSLSELSPPFKVMIDVTKPEITIESIAGDQVITQLEKKDGFTVKGSTKGAEEGNTVTILVEGKSYTTTVGKDGKWSIDLPKEATQDLTDGKTYTITASVTDKAGNQSSEANSKATVNAAPIVTTQTQTVEEDSGTSRFFQVKATDPEDNRINGYSLKYEVLQDTLDPSKGSVTMSESDHGHFKFTPAKDFSGDVTFSVKVTDSYGNSTIAEQKIIVTPVTDKPVATETNLDFDIGQLTLNRYEWSGLTGSKVINGKRYNFNATSGKQIGDGIPKETLEKAIEGLLMDKNYRPTQSSTHSLQASTLTEGHAVYMNGFVYLEAGKTYKYVGKADDAGMIKIGDTSEQYVSWQGLNAGSHSSEFSVSKTGFYTFDFYAHNQSGAGNYDFKVTEDNGESVKYYPSTDAIKKELPNFVQLGKFNDPDGNKKGFYELKYGYKGAETEEIQLNKIHAALTDRDGSETLSMKLEGIAEGTQLSYTAVSLDGSTQRHTAIAKNGLIEVKGDKNVLDFTDLVLILPKGVEETLQNVKLTVIATETMTNESVKTEFDFDIEVLSPSRDVHSTSDDDLFSTGSTGNDTLHYGLLSDDDTAGNGTDTWIDFAVGNPQTDDNADVIKFSEDFFSGLISTDLTADNLVNVEKFINVTYDQDTQTATISVDRDGVDDYYQQEELLLLTNQPTEISLEELLNNHQIVIG
ncbi:tandem-95 repeat protein, partial [Wohlfahrtiimonas chitiniclastica]